LSNIAEKNNKQQMAGRGGRRDEIKKTVKTTLENRMLI
jgi:hypothetical protein